MSPFFKPKSINNSFLYSISKALDTEINEFDRVNINLLIENLTAIKESLDLMIVLGETWLAGEFDNSLFQTYICENDIRRMADFATLVFMYGETTYGETDIRFWFENFCKTTGNDWGDIKDSFDDEETNNFVLSMVAACVYADEVCKELSKQNINKVKSICSIAALMAFYKKSMYCLNSFLDHIKGNNHNEYIGVAEETLRGLLNVLRQNANQIEWIKDSTEEYLAKVR